MKTILSVVAAISLFAAMGVTDNMTTQIICSATSLAVFFTSCKIYEKYYLTDKDKEERV